MKTKYPSLYLLAAAVTILCLALPTFAQQSPTVAKGPIVINEVKHDLGPMLREIAPLLPEFSLPTQYEIENPDYTLPSWQKAWKNRPVMPDPVLQTEENSPRLQTPAPGLEFDALGYGSQFFCNCMPADNDGAPGTTQYTEFVNLFYAVYDKQGNKLLGPLAGNSLWSGFGGACAADNNGDTIIRFDAAAQRWVASQFALPGGTDYECVAVSKTADATGAWYRYAFPFSNFPDYPKMGVWPDAYYFTFNNFTISGSGYVGANACAADRTKMLAGQSAQMICFQQSSSNLGMLPADLDGPTPPAAGTPNFVMELDPTGHTNLDMFQFHVDFVTPSNSTFTGPTKIPISSFTPLCNGFSRESCAKQPDAGSDLLETLSDRLMYRLVYRNFSDHSTLLVTHAVASGSSGGVRWYEIHNPETGPTVYQSGTFSPDSQYRFMPSIAMDASQDIAIGYTRSGAAAGQYPSLVYAGRTPSDSLGTLESEVVMLAGTGSQSSGGYDRWGDYSSMTVDPTDDCTFWFTESYIKTTGQNQGFNWSTAIGNFIFPGCGSTSPDFSLTANPTSVTITQGNSGTSTITVVPINGFNSAVTLSASGLPSGVTAGFNPNPTTTTSTLTLTASPTAATGTVTVTITGVSGVLSHQTTVSLTVNPSGPVVQLVPTSLKWGKVLVGNKPCCKTVTLTNTGASTLNISSIVPSGDFFLKTVAKSCKSTVLAGKSCLIKVGFAPTQKGLRTGAVTITDNAADSPQSIALSGTGK